MELRERAARAVFRAGFHVDEDEALVEEKWNDWPSEHRGAYRRADAILAIPEIARALQIAADYDKARLGAPIIGPE